MRVLSALLACACTLSACISNPDPRRPSLEEVQKSGRGGWIEVTLRDGGALRGELLAIDNRTVWVRTLEHQISWVPLYKVQRAELYTYVSDWGFGVWGFLGVVSTISHGFLLVFSAPVWLIGSSLVASDESRHVRLRYPEDDIAELSAWARYPQGMPKQQPRAPSNQEQAWALTTQAQQAARDGNCELVTQLDARVRALDPGLHDVTFMRDEAIRRCLGLPSLIAPPGETMPPGTTTPPGATPPSDAGVAP